MIGQVIGAYLLKHRIALGGMGVVYRAERSDGQFEREVAIKLIRPYVATEAGLRRFEFERKTLAGLNHPNIARLYDSGTTPDGSPYIVLELVEGMHIDQFCTDASLSIEDRLRLLSTVCRSVHFAHQNLIIHRDLKPGNILVGEDGVPKLLDFGIARLVQEDPIGEATGRGTTIPALMTLEYASPEQLLEEAVDGYRAQHSRGLDGLGRTLSTLSTQHLQLGHPDEAEALLEESIEVQTARLSRDHPIVLALLSRLATLRHAQGRTGEAAKVWDNVVALRRLASVEPHLGLARTLQEYGVFLLQTGSLESSESVLAESAKLLVAAPSADPALIGRAHLSLGVCLMRRRQLDQAERELRRGLELLEATAGIPAKDVDEARRHLAKLQEAKAANG